MRNRMLLVLVPLFATALLAAGCSDDDDDDDDDGGDAVATTTAAPADDGDSSGGGEAAPDAADLEVEDQSGDGTTLVIASVTLPTEGFIGVHGDADGSPGPVVGHSDLLPAGTSTDVTVTLDEPLAESATLWPMGHLDANGNGAYEFMPPDVTDDGPAMFADGSVAVLPLEYTVEG